MWPLDQIKLTLFSLNQDNETLRSSYFEILKFHLCYGSFVWSWHTKLVKRLHPFTKKSLTVMFFKSCNSDTCSLCRVFNILQSFDKTALKNCIFVSKSLKGWLPSVSRIKLSYGRYWLQMQYMFGDSKYRIYIQSEYRKIRTRNNSVFGHFSRSVTHKIAIRIWYFVDWDEANEKR